VKTIVQQVAMLPHVIMGNGIKLLFIKKHNGYLNMIVVLRFHSDKTCAWLSQHYVALFESMFTFVET